MSAPESSPATPASLWRNPGFLRLWLARIVSGIGTKITGLAIPLTAALVLHATPGQMAALVFAGQLPDLLFGLVAGVWVDRRRRRPLLVGADLGRAVLLALIPLAAVTGHLSFSLLWIVAFGSAILNLIFTLASVAVLPALVSHHQLVDANSKLALGDSVLTLAGPSLAGAIIQLVSAPKAIITDCLSYLASAFSIRSIGAREQAPTSGRPPSNLRAEIVEGLRALVETPLLLALALATGVMVVSVAIQQTILILYLTRTLHLPATTIGLLASVDGIGALLGAVGAGRLARRAGTGVVIIGGAALQTTAMFLMPLAGMSSRVLVVLILAQLCGGLGYAVFSINQISLRQRMTPIHLMGRVTSARRFVIFCMAPVGAALGGWLGTHLGLAPALVIGGIIAAGGVLVMLCSPIRQVRI